jgi:hypothetical protein
MLPAVLPDLLARGRRRVALVSSVAGYRGLPKSLCWPDQGGLINRPKALSIRSEGHRRYVINRPSPAPMTAQNEFKMPALLTPGRCGRDRATSSAASSRSTSPALHAWLKCCGCCRIRLLPGGAKFTGL